MRQTRSHLRSLADKNGYICAKGRKTPSIRIYDNGDILRADVRLDICTLMTVAQAYATLNPRG